MVPSCLGETTCTVFNETITIPDRICYTSSTSPPSGTSLAVSSTPVALS